MMENPGPACLVCVGLDGLAFLPAGDALLSRRAKAKSARYAVVVAERAAATNDKACWSSLWPWRTRLDFRRSANSTRPTALNEERFVWACKVKTGQSSRHFFRR
jgi:hypothetical protein